MRHTPDVAEVERMIERRLAFVATALKDVRDHLAQLNADTHDTRRFKAGPFDNTLNMERTAVVRVLDIVVAAMGRESK